MAAAAARAAGASSAALNVSGAVARRACRDPGGSAASLRVLLVLGLLGLIYGFLSPDFGLEPAEPDPVRLAGHRARLPDLLLGGIGDAAGHAAATGRTPRSSCTGRRSSSRSSPSSSRASVDFSAGARLRLHRLGGDRRAGRAGRARRRDARPRAGLRAARREPARLAAARPGARRGGRRRAAARPGRDDPGDDRHRRARGPVHHDDPAALPGRRDGQELEPARLGARLRRSSPSCGGSSCSTRTPSYVGAFEQTNVQVVLVTLGVFMLTTGGLWSYFRFRPARPRRPKPRPDPGGATTRRAPA